MSGLKPITFELLALHEKYGKTQASLFQCCCHLACLISESCARPFKSLSSPTANQIASVCNGVLHHLPDLIMHYHIVPLGLHCENLSLDEKSDFVQGEQYKYQVLLINPTMPADSQIMHSDILCAAKIGEVWQAKSAYFNIVFCWLSAVKFQWHWNIFKYMIISHIFTIIHNICTIIHFPLSIKPLKCCWLCQCDLLFHQLIALTGNQMPRDHACLKLCLSFLFILLLKTS